MLNISFALSFYSIGCSTFSVYTYILTPGSRPAFELSELEKVRRAAELLASRCVMGQKPKRREDVYYGYCEREDS